MEMHFFTSMKSLLLGISALLITVNPVTANLAKAPAKESPKFESSISRNWAGYAAADGKFTGVSGTWVVPEVAPKTVEAADAAWVGIGGVSSDDLIQGGTQGEVDSDGQVSYNAWFETLPHSQRMLPIEVNPGDSVTVSITAQVAPNWLLDFKNNTTGKSYQRTISYDSSMSSAEWIEEAPSSEAGFVPLDNFGEVKFMDAVATKNGAEVTPSEAGARPINMAGHDQLLASASSLGSGGDTFTVTRSPEEDVADAGHNPEIVRIEVQPGTDFFRIHIR
jgi:hypothetical protein